MSSKYNNEIYNEFNEEERLVNFFKESVVEYDVVFNLFKNIFLRYSEVKAKFSLQNKNHNIMLQKFKKFQNEKIGFYDMVTNFYDLLIIINERISTEIPRLNPTIIKYKDKGVENEGDSDIYNFKVLHELISNIKSNKVKFFKIG